MTEKTKTSEKQTKFLSHFLTKSNENSLLHTKTLKHDTIWLKKHINSFINYTRWQSEKHTNSRSN